MSRFYGYLQIRSLIQAGILSFAGFDGFYLENSALHVETAQKTNRLQFFVFSSSRYLSKRTVNLLKLYFGLNMKCQ
jgi:hypothetical protein